MRIKGSDLKRIIKEEISRMSEASGTEYYKQPSIEDFGGSDTWQEGEREVPELTRASPGLAKEAAEMFIQSKTQSAPFSRAFSDYMGGVMKDEDTGELIELGDDQVNTDNIAFAIMQKSRDEEWGKSYLNPAVAKEAAEVVANAIRRRMSGSSSQRSRGGLYGHIPRRRY